MKKVLSIVGSAVAAAVVFAAPVAAEVQTLALTAGVHNGRDAFVRRIDANVGDEVLVQMSFRNQSNERFSSIGARVVLPSQLSFVSGSTRVFNRTNPNGLAVNDGIATQAINIGGYGPMDNEGRGQGSVSYRVRVNGTGLVCGVNTLNIVNQIAGYQDGKIATDTFIAYTAVDVVRNCDSTGPDLPVTGISAVVGTAAGVGALATGAGYLLVSRKK